MMRRLLLGTLLGLAALALSFIGGRGSRAQSPVLRGTAPGLLAPVPLHAGLTIVRARFNGTGNFAAELLTQDPNQPPLAQSSSNWKDFYALFNSVGASQNSMAVMAKRDDNYYIHVTYADGSYEFTIEQPLPGNVTPVSQTSFTGKGLQVTPAFTLQPGNYTVSASTDSTGLRVYMYEIDDLGGQVIQPSSGSLSPDGRIIDASGSQGSMTTGSGQVSLLDAAPYLIYVDAEGAGPANWSLSIR
jgi:hypothetical protein